MLEPELNYMGMSKDQLEDLMMDASEEQEQLIVIELARRGEVSKICGECGEAIGHGLFCKKHSFMSIASLSKR